MILEKLYDKLEKAIKDNKKEAPIMDSDNPHVRDSDNPHSINSDSPTVNVNISEGS